MTTRKVRVQRTPREKWEIVQEGIRSRNVAGTSGRYGTAPNPFYRWKDEAEQGGQGSAKAYGYRRVSWRLPRKEGPIVNRKGAGPQVGWDLSARCRTNEALAARSSRQYSNDFLQPVERRG